MACRRALPAQSGRSLVRRCHLWANLEEQEARTAGLSSQGILELADLRKPTARMAVQFRRPQPQEVVGCDQPLQRLPSVAAAGEDGLAGGRVQVDGRWRRGLGRSGRTGWADGL
jgi:hypothetical protein